MFLAVGRLLTTVWCPSAACSRMRALVQKNTERVLMFGELRQDIAMCEVKNEPRGDKFGERHLDNTIMR